MLPCLLSIQSCLWCHHWRGLHEHPPPPCKVALPPVILQHISLFYFPRWLMSLSEMSLFSHYLSLLTPHRNVTLWEHVLIHFTEAFRLTGTPSMNAQSKNVLEHCESSNVLGPGLWSCGEKGLQKWGCRYQKWWLMEEGSLGPRLVVEMGTGVAILKETGLV